MVSTYRSVASQWILLEVTTYMTDLLDFIIWLLVLSTTQRCRSCLGCRTKGRTTGQCRCMGKAREKKKNKEKQRNDALGSYVLNHTHTWEPHAQTEYSQFRPSKCKGLLAGPSSYFFLQSGEVDFQYLRQDSFNLINVGVCFVKSCNASTMQPEAIPLAIFVLSLNKNAKPDGWVIRLSYY